MKKQVLLTTGMVISGLLGAQVSKQTATSKIPAHLANIAIQKNIVCTDVQPVNNSQVNHTASNNKTSAFTMGVIGQTYYDLQSNSSVGDRIVVNADGSIAAVWTSSFTDDSKVYADRGTGYAYYNGSTWSAAPTTRVENSRVGWGNIVNTRNGKELILSHETVVSRIKLASRATKGTGAWTEVAPTMPSAITAGNSWPRMVSSGGDTIYALSVTQNTATAGATLYQGLNGAVCFSRSKNGGATWDIVNVVPTGLDDLSRFTGFGGDAYAIAAHGSTVAIVAGDAGKDVVLTKSTDGGVTWTKTTILKFPIAAWNPATTTTDANGDNIPDTLDTNDGTFAIGLDNNNNAYVFYGNSRVLQTTPSATYSYFPYVDGLNMWKEGMPADVGGIEIAGIEDLGPQGTLEFPTPASGLAFGRWGNSLTSYPSVAFDASNVMYLSYSSIVDGLQSLINPDKLVRHVYLMKSSDGGTTWTAPCDIVGSPNQTVYEGVFASMAKRVDNSVHLIYQRDLAPGNGVPGAAAGDNPDELENTGTNDIVYFKIPTSEIGACSIDVGVKEQSSIATSLKFYPNPTSSNGTLEITLNDNVKMDINILNNIGQVVYSTTVNGNSGNNKVDLNLAGLNSGMYFYQVKAGNSKTITNKLVIAK